MTDIKPLAFAAVLTAALVAPASAATVTRDQPILVYDGLLMYPDRAGRHKFRPADGIDFWMGKGKGDRMPEMSASRPNPPRWRASLPPTAYAPIASRWGHTALFDWSYWGWGCGCGTPETPPGHKPPETSPVPLPAALWLLLAGLGALALMRRL